MNNTNNGVIMKELITASSVFLRGVICGLLYLGSILLIVVVACGSDFYLFPYIIGIVYGVVAAIVCYCNKIIKTIFACLISFISVIIAHFFLSTSGIPDEIALSIYRSVNDEFISETGRLSTNHRVGYGFGTMMFWGMAAVIFLISISSIISIKSMRNKKDEHYQ